MGKFVNNTEEFFKYCEENEVKFVDLRFTDMKGMWHHLTYMLSAVNEDNLTNGMPFDGSSVDAWQPINKSDMLLKPDVETAFLDLLLRILQLYYFVMFMTFTKVNYMKNVQDLLLKKLLNT